MDARHLGAVADAASRVGPSGTRASRWDVMKVSAYTSPY